MFHFTEDPARLAADQMVKDRCYDSPGIQTFKDYLARCDARSTAHLSPGRAAHVLAHAGKQRREAFFTLDPCGTVIIHIPLNNPRAPKETLWVDMLFSRWIILMETFCLGSLFIAYKDRNRKDAQVRTMVPFSGQVTTTNATLVRLLTGAKRGQQARLIDGNPLNLRESNLKVNGNPEGSRKGTAKTDTAAFLAEQVSKRDALAGMQYDIPDHD